MLTKLNRLACCLALFGFVSCTDKKPDTHAGEKTQWSEYLGGADRNHYSPLIQIDTGNVKNLTVAWEYHTGDSGQMQCNPIIIDTVLFAITANNAAFAVNAATGTKIWTSKIAGSATGNVNRGVTYWSDGNDKRVLYTYGSWLTALNANTGEVINNFGDSGKVSLKTGLGDRVRDKYVGSTTPGTVFEDLIIMPIRVDESEGGAPGYIQAFNIRTGKLAWVFRTIPYPGEIGYETWPSEAHQDLNIGGANSWAGMSVDRERGILFVPTGSPSFDFYGGGRKGNNEPANSLIAIDVKTGKYKWHYQTVHHDLWDRDLPAPPNLVRVKHEGKDVDAVAQITKSGFVFLFDRETGKPLFPIEEKSVPASTVPGEWTSPTQPIPSLPKPFSRQEITEADISNIAKNRDELVKIFRASNKALYDPLALDKDAIILPGADGGGEWGGAAADPQGILYVNASEMAWLFALAKNTDGDINKDLTQGNVIYNKFCVACHGADRKGNTLSGYPSLLAIGTRLKREEVSKIITNGKGMMPGFVQIRPEEKQALIDFLFDEEKKEGSASIAKTTTKPTAPSGNKLTTDTSSKAEVASSGSTKSPYRFKGYNKFLDSRGYPAITPPWGTLSAIDLNTGALVWTKTFGEYKELTAEGVAPTGAENYGGPVVTAGGVLFIAATKDGMFRAYNKRTGELLFEKELPAAGFATPSTYSVNGKQYVVVACGGTKLGTKKGDSYIAFVLP
ncbi:MAG: pyrroloquinoline quinone-dependent dehydrogenase [Chitinophagaceae bacterium]|nr:MAG: pyrroloquinoline quinone-dependent dehydrogenase [Chitinophagaceae bacterium]